VSQWDQTSVGGRPSQGSFAKITSLTLGCMSPAYNVPISERGLGANTLIFNGKFT